MKDIRRKGLDREGASPPHISCPALPRAGTGRETATSTMCGRECLGWRGQPDCSLCPTCLVQRGLLLRMSSKVMLWKRLSPPAHLDICPGPPGQLKLSQGLFVLKQLCQQKMNSQACSSTAHL